MSVTCDLPPSALFVRYVVAQHQPISRATLTRETDLPESTLDRALKRLREEGHIKRSYIIGDGRYSAYILPS